MEAWLELEKILQHLFAVFCKDRFRVKLNAVDGVLFVAQSHDLAFLRPCGDLQAIGKGVAFDDERVVAGGFERTGKSLENAGAVVKNGGGLSVHQPIGADDIAAIDLADGLVAKADAEDGSGWAELADEL